MTAQEQEESYKNELIVSAYLTCFTCNMRTNKRFDEPVELGDFEKYKANLLCQKCSNPYGSIVPVTNFEDEYQKDRHEKSQTHSLKEVIAYKYSGNGKYQLHESVILNGIPCFITYDPQKEKLEIKYQIEEPNRLIRPPSREECPFPAYEFDNENELNDYITRAKQITSIAELFNASKYFWTLYIDQDAQILTILAVDSILSYFQDLFPVIHYVEGVGSNDVGKSSIGYTFQYTGYRPVKATSITGPNYLRLFGTVEPGQCTIIEDEGDNISDDPDKTRVLKAGYEHNARIPRINTNTKNQEQKWYYVYGYKMILAEKSLRQLKAKGLVDRTFTLKCRPGRVKYAIKDVVSQVINKDEKLDILYQELVDFRKLMLCYRLIHYTDQMHRIKVNLENRDKELAFPILQLFFGTSCFEEVKEALEFFVKQRRERKSNSLEAALYPILYDLIYPKGEELCVTDQISIPFSKIWDKIVTDNAIQGNYDPKKPYEYDTKEYGKIYRRTLCNLISDIFGAVSRHTNKGTELIFKLKKFDSFKNKFSGIGIDEEVKIEVRLERRRDACDASDANLYPLSKYRLSTSKEMGDDPSKFESLASLSSPTLAKYRLLLIFRQISFLNHIQFGFRTCQNCGETGPGFYMKPSIHQCNVNQSVNEKR